MAEHWAVLTVTETAHLLRISRGLAYEMVKDGRLPSLRLGRRILVPRSALERILAEAAGDQSPEALPIRQSSERSW